MGIMLADGQKVSLTDRYVEPDGSVFLTGIQALVRLMLDQQRLDRARGLRTAAFVSGYEGSPLGGLDIELARRRKLLDELEIVHRPALNEELAATAVAGTQLAPDRPDARTEGVVGYWYGKTPGLDRASDALRHANFGGTHHLGGAVALVGDDPTAKSSTMAGASEATLADLAIPILYPAGSQEVVDLGLHAVAMSRASGLWSAMKIVTNVADGAEDVLLPADRDLPRMPHLEEDGRPFRHTPTSKLLGPMPVEAERTAYGIRMDVAREYARLNVLNELDSHGAKDRIGIVAAGKSYLDLHQALRTLGLDAAAREAYGIRLLKVGMLFPLEVRIFEEFSRGLEEIIVVEEKRPFLETALKEHLYGRADVPVISGKRDPSGVPLLQSQGELDADTVVAALARRLGERSEIEPVRRWLERDRSGPETGELLPVLPKRELPIQRTPYFCSGCPHNTSTKTPDGSVVGAGIGCHTMVLLMDPERVGEVVGLTQMGGEGAQWIGMAPFVEGDHIIQNMGDGTFHHSGSLAIRAAVAAGVNITYKLLYNSAVAMTGGQQAVGLRSVSQLTELLHAEGAARVIVTTEEPDRYRGVRLAGGAEVRHRDDLERVQEELAEVPGVTVLIHDQQCAVEKRRSRKRNPPERPERRVMINERVCEGCGDCGTKSNCLSVEPVETKYGRKTAINQATCNLDYSCLDGDCPSFVTVRPSPNKKASVSSARVGVDTGKPIPDPAAAVGTDQVNIRITGIGGTGVVTVAQIVANAAHLAGMHVRTLDQTGVSQKAGPVVSDIKISREPLDQANKLGHGECDLYLGCDALVAAEAKNLLVTDRARTLAVVSTAEVPTGKTVADPTVAFPDIVDVLAPIEAATRAPAGAFVDARGLAEAELGGDQFANIVLLGSAYQAGGLPLPLEALEQAIRLNGVAIEQNLSAFRLGRLATEGDLVVGAEAGPGPPEAAP
ncbi:MAG: indolepyruvate ferredoxin oxidoreductase family protein, partial [Solirubrobacterales bacterium]